MASPPPALAYLWHAFGRLRRRKGGGWGAVPIEWTDIEAFCRRSGLRLRPWEIEIIETLDDLFVGRVNNTKPVEKKPEPAPARPLTVGLFDALFG